MAYIQMKVYFTHDPVSDIYAIVMKSESMLLYHDIYGIFSNLFLIRYSC